LRAYARRPVLGPGNPVMDLIVQHSPHRVFATRVGRVEIYQAIPAEDATAMDGPRTLVQPELLAKGRLHPASEPIPRNFVPCGYLYPTHPLHDVYGRPRPFDGPRYVAFQRMLSRYGEVEYVRLKRNVTKGVIGGLAPSSIALPDDRFAQASIAVALRQLKASEGTSENLVAWFGAYDRGPDADEVALGG